MFSEFGSNLNNLGYGVKRFGLTAIFTVIRKRAAVVEQSRPRKTIRYIISRGVATGEKSLGQRAVTN